MNIRTTGTATGTAAVEDLDGYQLVERVAGITEQISHLEAERLMVIKELYDSEYMLPRCAPPSAQAEAKRMGRLIRDLDRGDTTRAELMMRLRLRPGETRRLVETAVALCNRFPQTLEALSQGRLDLTRAQIIGEVGMPLADDHYRLALQAGASPESGEKLARTIAGLLEEHILKRASGQAPENLRECLHRAINRLDPDYAHRHVKENLRGRQVTHRTHRGEGTGELHAYLGAAEALAAYNVIDTYARAARQAGSKRTLNELRADVLADLILRGHLPDGRTLGQVVQIDTVNATVVPDVDPHTGDVRREPNDPQASPAQSLLPFRTVCGDEDPNSDGRVDSDGWVDSEGRGDSVVDGSAVVDTPGVMNRQDADDGLDAANWPGAAGYSESGIDPNANAATKIRVEPVRSWPSRSGVRAQVQVTVGLTTLLGMDEEAAELAGHGPITPPLPVTWPSQPAVPGGAWLLTLSADISWTTAGRSIALRWRWTTTFGRAMLPAEPQTAAVPRRVATWTT